MKILLTFLVSAHSMVSLSAVVTTWTATGTESWDDPGNWTTIDSGSHLPIESTGISPLDINGSSEFTVDRLATLEIKL